MKFLQSIALSAFFFASLSNPLQASDCAKKECSVTRIFNKLTESQWVYYLAGLSAMAAAMYLSGHPDNAISSAIKSNVTETGWLATKAPQCVAATAAAGLFCASTRKAEEHGKKH